MGLEMEPPRGPGGSRAYPLAAAWGRAMGSGRPLTGP